MLLGPSRLVFWRVLINVDTGVQQGQKKRFVLSELQNMFSWILVTELVVSALTPTHIRVFHVVGKQSSNWWRELRLYRTWNAHERNYVQPVCYTCWDNLNYLIPNYLRKLSQQIISSQIISENYLNKLSQSTKIISFQNYLSLNYLSLNYLSLNYLNLSEIISTCLKLSQLVWNYLKV